MNWKMSTLLIALLAILASCNGEPVSKVNGEKILLSDLDKIVSVRVQQYEAQGQTLEAADIAAVREELLTGLVDQALLRQEAEELKLSPDEEKVEEQYQNFLAQFETEEEAMSFLEEQGYDVKMLKKDISVDLLVQSLLEQELYPLADPDDAAVEAFYNDNPQYFTNPESVHARHILIKVASDMAPEASTKEEAMDRMEQVLTQLDEGADFAELASAVSEGPSSAQGGDLGWFSRGQMVAEFEDAAFNLEAGEISPIVETQFGLHVIKMEERKEAGTSSLDEVRESIVNYLRQEKLPGLYDEYITSLRSEADIEYFNTDDAAADDAAADDAAEEVTEG